MSEQHNQPRLIADIGGTNARFALIDGGKRRDEVVLACADYPDVVSAIEHYLESIGAAKGVARPIEGALAIAGPITGDLVHLTNHAWQFSAARTRQALGWRRLIMLNDFTALAMAIRHLPRHELEPVGGSQLRAIHSRDRLPQLTGAFRAVEAFDPGPIRKAATAIERCFANRSRAPFMSRCARRDPL